jgi:hypothetical protein
MTDRSATPEEEEWRICVACSPPRIVHVLPGAEGSMKPECGEHGKTAMVLATSPKGPTYAQSP